MPPRLLLTIVIQNVIMQVNFAFIIVFMLKRINNSFIHLVSNKLLNLNLKLRRES